jgi:hypothetical protein
MDLVQIAKPDLGAMPVVPVRLHANQYVVASCHRFRPQPEQRAGTIQ